MEDVGEDVEVEGKAACESAMEERLFLWGGGRVHGRRRDVVFYLCLRAYEFG